MNALNQNLKYETDYKKFVELLPANGKVLDAAYQQGIYARLFAQKGYDVTAVSLNPSQQTPRVDSRIKVIHKSFEELSLPYRSFDGVWAVNSLTGVARDQLWQVFSQFVDWLRVGGILSFCMIEGEGYKITKEQSPLGGVKTKLQTFYQPEELEQLLTSIDCPAVDAWYEQRGDRRLIHVLARREK